jgi:hypothetical protein
MSQIAVSWKLLTDGTRATVKLVIRGEFSVAAANATAEAEAGIAALIARISTEPEESIQDKLTADRWLGNYQRPEEPAATGKQGSRACMPRPADASVPVRSLPSGPSRRDPMPVLFVAALAVAAVLGIFGLISIAQFLSDIGRGN